MALHGKNGFEVVKINIRALPIIFRKWRPWGSADPPDPLWRRPWFDLVWPDELKFKSHILSSFSSPLALAITFDLEKSHLYFCTQPQNTIANFSFRSHTAPTARAVPPLGSGGRLPPLGRGCGCKTMCCSMLIHWKSACTQWRILMWEIFTARTEIGRCPVVLFRRSLANGVRKRFVETYFVWLSLKKIWQ